MAIDAVFWGARRSGKTTALHAWCWKKRNVFWYIPSDDEKYRRMKREYHGKLNVVNRLSDELRGITYLVVDDAEFISPRNLQELLLCPLYAAVSFTPPIQTDTKNPTVLILKEWSKLPCAKRLDNPFMTEQELRKIQNEMSPLYWKTQMLGRFLDDDA